MSTTTTEPYDIWGNGREVDLIVYIYPRPNMRDNYLEYEFQMGRRVLEGCFDTMTMMPEVKELFLSFPENHMNILEQRQLYRRLGHYCPNLKKVTIKTQSVYIIQCTKAGCCRIMRHPDGDIEETSDVTVKLWNPMVGNVIGPGLNVLNRG